MAWFAESVMLCFYLNVYAIKSKLRCNSLLSTTGPVQQVLRVLLPLSSCYHPSSNLFVRGSPSQSRPAGLSLLFGSSFLPSLFRVAVDGSRRQTVPQLELTRTFCSWVESLPLYCLLAQFTPPSNTLFLEAFCWQLPHPLSTQLVLPMSESVWTACQRVVWSCCWFSYASQAYPSLSYLLVYFHLD